MSWSPLILIEIVLVFGSVLGWGLWELWVLRKDRRETERRAAAQTDRSDPA